MRKRRQMEERLALLEAENVKLWRAVIATLEGYDSVAKHVNDDLIPKMNELIDYTKGVSRRSDEQIAKYMNWHDRLSLRVYYLENSGDREDEYA